MRTEYHALLITAWIVALALACGLTVALIGGDIVRVCS